MELANADGAGTVQEVDSLKRDVRDKDEEIRRLTNLLETKEEVAEGRGAGEEGRRGVEEVELSDVRAKLEEEKDSRMRAEEELMSVQVCITWLFMTAFLVYNYSYNIMQLQSLYICLLRNQRRRYQNAKSLALSTLLLQRLSQNLHG